MHALNLAGLRRKHSGLCADIIDGFTRLDQLGFFKAVGGQNRDVKTFQRLHH
jgi:hypothetical protein